MDDKEDNVNYAYVVHAFKGGDINGHGYVVAVCQDIDRAKDLAAREEFHKQFKYACVLYQVPICHVATGCTIVYRTDLFKQFYDSKVKETITQNLTSIEHKQKLPKRPTTVNQEAEEPGETEEHRSDLKELLKIDELDDKVKKSWWQRLKDYLMEPAISFESKAKVEKNEWI